MMPCNVIRFQELRRAKLTSGPRPSQPFLERLDAQPTLPTLIFPSIGWIVRRVCPIENTMSQQSAEMAPAVGMADW